MYLLQSLKLARLRTQLMMPAPGSGGGGDGTGFAVGKFIEVWCTIKYNSIQGP